MMKMRMKMRPPHKILINNHQFRDSHRHKLRHNQKLKLKLKPKKVKKTNEPIRESNNHC